MVTFVECGGCNYKGTKIEKNQEQDFVSREKLRNIQYKSCLETQKWRNNEAESKVKYIKYGRKNTIVEEEISEEERRNIWYLEYKTKRKQLQQNQRVAVHLEQEKAQQSSTQTETPKGIAKEKGKQREVRRTFKILREVWLNIGVKKIDTHKDVIVKVLLDSGTMGILIDQKIVARYGFRLQKLVRPIVVRNMDRTNNSAEVITYQVEANIYYKNHIKRIRIDICDLGRTDIILGMLQLQVHNLEINQKTGEVKITRCPPLCRRNTKLKEEKRAKKEKRVVTLEEKKIVRQAVDNKEDWRKEKKIKAHHRKIKEIVPQKFLK